MSETIQRYYVGDQLKSVGPIEDEYVVKETYHLRVVAALEAERDALVAQVADLAVTLGKEHDENATLRAKVAQLSAPVSGREWADAQTLSPSIYLSNAERATQIIDDRAAEPVAPCEYRGPICHGGAEHNARVESRDSDEPL